MNKLFYHKDLLKCHRCGKFISSSQYAGCDEIKGFYPCDDEYQAVCKNCSAKKPAELTFNEGEDNVQSKQL